MNSKLNCCYQRAIVLAIRLKHNLFPNKINTRNTLLHSLLIIVGNFRRCMCCLLRLATIIENSCTLSTVYNTSVNSIPYQLHTLS